jgi:hypothetical protein
MAAHPHPFREAFPYCLKIFLGVGIALYLVALMGVSLLPDLSHVPDDIRQSYLPQVPTPVDVPGWPAHSVTPGWHNVFTSWEREDALWFLKIASRGYSSEDASAAFFPLYPIAIKVVATAVGGHPLAGGLLVSSGAFLAALVVLYALTARELGGDVARRAVVYAAVFPTSLFFYAPYSESLFFLLVLLTFWWARRGRWPAAAAAGALAALTRNLGVLLVIALAVEALLQAREEARAESGAWRLPVGRLLWSGVPVVGTLSYLAYWGVRSGDWLAPLHKQANWQREFSSPLATFGHGTQDAFRYIGIYAGGYHQLDWVVTIAILVLAGYALARFRPSYSLHLWASILVPLAFVFPGRPLIAFTRYALPLFPLFWALARLTGRSRGTHEVAVATSAALLGISTLLFVNWYYII